MSRLGRCLAVLTGVLLAAGLGTGVAAAAPPSNDTEAGAVAIVSLPFTDSIDTSDATPGGPRICSTRASVFYSFRSSARLRVQIDLIGSEYDTTLGVYTRDASGAAERVDCNKNTFGDAAAVRFRARPGVTYFIMVGAGRYGDGEGGPLTLTADKVSNVELEYAVAITGGTTDPSTGIATLSGTLTCNEPSAIYMEGELRELRQGLYVARGSLSIYEACRPGAPAAFTVDVDTYSGIAFGPGSARVRTYYDAGWDGFQDYVEHYDTADVTVTLT
jgi:hypothetical protein